MDHARWQKISAIVDQALVLETPSERTVFINNRCENDPQLKREVTQWLDSILNSEELWNELLLSNQVLMDEMTLSDSFSTPETTNGIPEKIGPYTIKEGIGRGGMGNVYLAKRADADFHEAVAIKVIRHEAINSNQLQRFLQERSLLSRLNHPNIARLLDGGLSADERPYYVMEYVDGMPITKYCKMNHCTFDERLTLFTQVCKAVQYAHSNFIVHRDLKPDNILVTPGGTVKILDFGIAKLLDGELTEKSLLQTRIGQRLLSLNYAAPEQITMEATTTATDVYALGLLLYELFAGCRPLDLKNKKLVETEQIIRKEEPQKPSSAGSIFQDKLRGDLDAIILKSLRKEPGQRYESASRLLDDIENYRHSRPVQARKGNLQYRTGKFVKRNKTVLTAAILFLVGAVGFGVYHIHQLNQERNHANTETEKAQAVSDLLIGIFQNADPWEQPNTDITAREILNKSTSYVQEQTVDQPQIKGALLGALGEIYQSLGMYKKSKPLLEEAIQNEQQLLHEHKGSEYSLAANYHRLGNLLISEGEYNSAIVYFKKASVSFKKLDNSNEYAESLLEWGWAEFELANYEVADSLYSLAISLKHELFDSKSIEIARSLQFRAWLEQYKGNYSVADSLFSNVLSIYRNHYDDDRAEIAQTLHGLGWVKLQLGEYDKAISLNKTALRMKQRLFSAQSHPEIAWTLNNLGVAFLRVEKLELAETYFKDALAMRRATLPENHRLIAQSLSNLGSLYFYKEQYDKAETVLKNLIAISRTTLGSDHPDVARNLNNLATTLNRAGKNKEAIPFYAEAISIQEKKFKATHPSTLNMRSSMGDAYVDIGEFEKAEKLRLKNFEAVKEEKGLQDEHTQRILQTVIDFYKKWKKTDKEQAYASMLISNK